MKCWEQGDYNEKVILRPDAGDRENGVHYNPLDASQVTRFKTW